MILMNVLGPSVGQLHMSSLYHLKHFLKNYHNMFIFDAENETDWPKTDWVFSEDARDVSDKTNSHLLLIF